MKLKIFPLSKAQKCPKVEKGSQKKSLKLRVCELEDRRSPTTFLDALQSAVNDYQTAVTSAESLFNTQNAISAGNLWQSLNTQADARQATIDAAALNFDSAWTTADQSLNSSLSAAGDSALSLYGPNAFDESASYSSNTGTASAAQTAVNDFISNANAINSQADANIATAGSTFVSARSAANLAWDSSYVLAANTLDSATNQANATYTAAEVAANSTLISATNSAYNT